MIGTGSRVGSAWRRAPVLRVIFAVGPTRVLRLIVAVILVGAWLTVILQIRPDLGRPSTFGSDTSNYYAAGLRLAAGHPLYEMNPGDRPVAADSPPFFSAPLLSPPPVAVLWRGLSILPGPAIVAIWWVTGLVLTSIALALIVARAPWPGLVGAGALAYPLAIVAFSGNVNAFLIPMTLVTWRLTRGSGASTRSVVVAALIALVAAALKLTPVFVLWWIVCQAPRRTSLLAIIAIAGLAIGVVVVATSGTGSLADYLAISRATASQGSTDLSPSGLLRLIGLSSSIASLAPVMVGALVGLAILLARDRPRLTFGLAIGGMVLASPVVRLESLGLLIVAAGPWLAERNPAGADAPDRRLVPPSGRAAVAIVTGLVLLASTLIAARTDSSRAIIHNGSNDEAIVRFVDYASRASFGFVLAGGTSGVAWADVPGGPNGSIVMLDASCHIEAVEQATISPTVVGITPGRSMVIASDEPAEPSATTGAALPYSSRCAAEVLPAAGP